MSNSGEPQQVENLLAPGFGLVGARAGDGTIKVSGTSFVTAVATGAGGLLWSLALRHSWLIDGTALRAILLDLAERCTGEISFCRRSMAGRLDLRTARALIAQSASGRGRKSGEILLDEHKHQLDEFAVRLARRRRALASSGRAQCALSEGKRTSYEPFGSSTSAEFALRRDNAAIREVMSGNANRSAKSSATPRQPTSPDS